MVWVLGVAMSEAASREGGDEDAGLLRAELDGLSRRLREFERSLARQANAIQRLEDEARSGRSSSQPAPLDGAWGVDRVIDEFVSGLVSWVRSLPVWILAVGDAVSAVVVLVFVDWLLTTTTGLLSIDVVWPVWMVVGGLVFVGSVTVRRWWPNRRAEQPDRAPSGTRPQ